MLSLFACGGFAGGERARERADGLAVRVHDNLEAWPEEHGGSVDVAVYGRDLAALERKGEMLIEADAYEDTETVVGVLD